jgi:acetylglutamate kinase
MKLVIKVGGEVARSPELPALAGDIAALARGGHATLVVHGGGPQATELQERLGQHPRIVGGRRITDDATLEIVKMTVAGAINVDLCAAIVRAGGRPVGLHGASSLVIRAARRPPIVVAGGGDAPVDFGWVGDVTGLGDDLLRMLFDKGYVPVLACLGADEDGRVYNINADTVACRAAVELGADALVLVTDVAGVLLDVADPGSRLARLTLAEAERAIAQGIVTKGMIPKLTESFTALRAGVGAVHIVGRLRSGDLLRAVSEPGSVGTALVN